MPAELVRRGTFLDAPGQAAAPAVPPGEAADGAPVAAPVERWRRILVLSAAAMQEGAVCEAVEAAGWGLLQMPPPERAAPARRLAIELVADQIEDYLRHAYQVCALPAADIASLNAELLRRGGPEVQVITNTANLLHPGDR